MPYEIHNRQGMLTFELKGRITSREVQELAKSLCPVLTSETAVTVLTSELTHIDTCVLQMLISVRKTAARFVVEKPSETFISVVDRSALRRDLLKETEEES